ncbi:MAG: M12 family metallo-peptidase [Lysobacteraceae bacterium]
MLPNRALLSAVIALLLVPVPAMARFEDQPPLTLSEAQLATLAGLGGRDAKQIRLLQTGKDPASRHAWLVEPLAVYAENAVIHAGAPASGTRLQPVRTRYFTVTDDSNYRWSLGVSPETGEVVHAVLVGPDGIRGSRQVPQADGSLRLEALPADLRGPDGETLMRDCGGGLDDPAGAAGSNPIEHIKSLWKRSATADGKLGGGLATAEIAVDTDNELLADKFSGNTSTANTYIANLFAAMNTLYESELGLHLEIKSIDLRTSPDPFTTSGSPAGSAELNEFGNWWAANRAAVDRDFVMLLSGKSSSDTSASGIAWVLNSGSYCTATAGNGGHYSVNQVFKFTFNGGALGTVAYDLGIVAHELGHNLGAVHTHCSNGPQIQVDNCYNIESSGFGTTCYAGPASCPATNGGVGTLMSYCHLGISDCGDNVEIFSPNRKTFLLGRVSSNTPVCLDVGGGANDIFANGFE